ncbi:MAG: c-type cytochrome [Humidesulfovibrio sp.]|uniref:c-type cytochrome n=1 Tax=Humidesulfovibrio sp. TaxID=2910988 RepID=UPI0027E6920F|nr:c-type cytochrome [Humidesulfovibrio sp.]MDQ7836466.1 c-type cytochrome [Humidesulfovibrio sp.]
MKLTLSLTLALSLALGATALAADAATDAAALYNSKCASCHGKDGSKTILSKPVKGLSAEDFTKKMMGYKAKTYGGSKKAGMEKLAAALSDADIKALAAYTSKF